MKNNLLRNIILCILSVLFLAAGIFILSQQLSRSSMYADAIEQAQHAADNPDRSKLEAAQAEQSKLQAETEEMNEQIAALQEEIDAQDGDIAKLQQEYEKQAEEADAEYYKTILKSLSEGVSLVEQYISGEK